MFRRSALSAPVKRSLRYSLRDGAAFAVMSGAGESYFSAFALFLKATSQEIAWLAAFPPLIGSWMQLVSAWIGRAGRRRKTLIVAGTLSQALVWLPLMLLPLVFPDQATALLILCVVLFHVSGNLVQPQWSSLMGDLVPERRRGRYFARRNRLASLATLLSLIGAGIILHASSAQGHALVGFLAVFAIAAVARLVSSYYLSRMSDPEEDGPIALPNGPRGLTWLKFLHGSPFLRFSVSIAALQAAVAMAAPFFAVYMLRDLEFSYLQFMLITASSTIMQLLTLNTWGQISDRLGNRVVLVFTGWLVAVLPALWLVSGNFWYLMIIQLLSGLGWGGFNLSAGNYLYDLRPGRPLAAYMAVHNVLIGAAVFGGAACGGYLAVHLPKELTLLGEAFAWEHALFGVFAISTAARLIVVTGLLTSLGEVRLAAHERTCTLIFRMARLNTVTGMVMDIVGVMRNGRGKGELEPATVVAMRVPYPQANLLRDRGDLGRPLRTFRRQSIQSLPQLQERVDRDQLRSRR